jgi:prephenate dehydratase
MSGHAVWVGVARVEVNRSGMKLESDARVAFQGERGAFSEEAAVKLLGNGIVLVPRPTFEAMFDSIEENAADYILAPIENSLAGSVHRTFDLLIESRLSIIAEEVIPIVLNLIGVPGATVDGITTVESHPVALAQCEKFFHSRPELKRIATEDTAGSVREIIAAGDPARAAIASRGAAEIHGGKILVEHLEDNPENYTRFLLLGPSSKTSDAANKLSLVFQTAHRPGALFHALGPFARRGINLMKIESRPIAGRPWEYRFYLDLQASALDPEVEAAIAELEKMSVNLRILGSYVSAEIFSAKANEGTFQAHREMEQ